MVWAKVSALQPNLPIPPLSNIGKALTSPSTGSAIARVAISNTLSQGVAMAVGAQSRFSWAGVAAAAVGAGVGSNVRTDLGSRFGDNLTSRFASAVAAGTTVSVLSGGKVNAIQVATDAFGNALGNSVVDQLSLGGDLSGQDYSAGSGLAAGHGLGLRVTQADLETVEPQSLRYGANTDSSYVSYGFDTNSAKLPTQLLSEPAAIASDYPRSTTPPVMVAAGYGGTTDSGWSGIDEAMASGRAGRDFATGLLRSSDDRSVMDPPPSDAQHAGYIVHDGIGKVLNGVKEVALEWADLFRMGSNALSGGPAFMADTSAGPRSGSATFQPWSQAGVAAQNGSLTIQDLIPNPLAPVAEMVLRPTLGIGIPWRARVLR
ncbi:hypothetical protein BOSP111201_13130 [Bordetella sputigena]|uniref:hypothetical protein n=1 Tax=Bordetella sputigena TaxID=1416810 RepID=UPI0039EFC15B